jgi:hypothetical protein
MDSLTRVIGNGGEGLSRGKRAALALVVATLIFGQQIASWSTPGNRFLYFWQRSDALWLITAILVMGILLFGLAQVVRRWGSHRVRRGFRLLFSVGFVQLLVTLFLPSSVERPLGGAASTMLLVAGLVTAGIWLAEATVVRATVTAGLLLAPLPPILFLQMLTWRPWRQCADRVAPAPEPNARPVFVLLFDEWSLHRSTDRNGFLLELSRLRELAQTSFVFRNARSPGKVSYKSIPRILFQEPGSLTIGNGRAEWTDASQSNPIEGRPNLFRLARSHGYGTALSGWYLPYAALVGDDLDRCRVYQQEVKRRGALRLWDVLWANLQFLPDPVSRGTWWALYSRIFSENWFQLAGKIERDALDLARHSPQNTLVLIHYPLPHGPFIFEANGGYRGPFPGSRLHGTTDDYERHLLYMDSVLGKFLDALEHSGRLDSALVVVTSDHSWQRDPDVDARTPSQLQQVPLLVKWPGQRFGASVQREFCLLDLGGIIEAAIGERITPIEARVLLDTLTSSPAAPRCRE